MAHEQGCSKYSYYNKNGQDNDELGGQTNDRWYRSYILSTIWPLGHQKPNQKTFSQEASGTSTKSS